VIRSDCIVKLGDGKTQMQHELRLIEVLDTQGNLLSILTNDLKASAEEIIGQIYRYRWQIELFFKMLVNGNTYLYAKSTKPPKDGSAEEKYLGTPDDIVTMVELDGPARGLIRNQFRITITFIPGQDFRCLQDLRLFGFHLRHQSMPFIDCPAPTLWSRYTSRAAHTLHRLLGATYSRIISRFFSTAKYLKYGMAR
jgi:hypothetical protein